MLVALVCAATVLAACSSGDDDGTEERGDPTTTTTDVRFTGDAGSPFCTTLAGLDIDQVLGDESLTPEQLGAAFGQLVAVLDELAGLAPEDVRGDAELLAEGIAALDDALAAAGYDFDVLATSPAAAQVTAAVNDPAFTVAGDRLQAYREQVCGL